MKYFSILFSVFFCACHLPLLNRSFPAGTIIEVKADGMENLYRFCQDDTARVDIGASKILNHKRFGTFESTPAGIKILWQRELGTRGVGKPTGCSNGYCVYADYRPFQKYLYEEELLDLDSLRRSGSVSIAGYRGVCDPFR